MMLPGNQHMNEYQQIKRYILGRNSQGKEGLLFLGHFHALDTSRGAKVYMDVLRPHVCLICGKRGYGKSYTMGVMVEEIAKQDITIRRNLSVILIDSLGIFWSLAFPNTHQGSILEQYNIFPESFTITLYTTRREKSNWINERIRVKKLSLKTADISPMQWCQLFDVSQTDPVGILLSKTIQQIRTEKKYYTIDDIIKKIKNDKQSEYHFISAAENLLRTAQSWQIFSKQGMDINEFFSTESIHIIDLSVIEPDDLKTMITGILADVFFKKRVEARKTEELIKMGICKKKKRVPVLWLAIDEAQLYVPKDKRIFSKSILKDKWMRLGRQPGLSLVLSTQKPSLIDPEVFSHADLIFSHRLTADEDIQALRRIHPSYLSGDMQGYIGKIGTEKGVALVIDDIRESVHIIRIRPRRSWHGGDEPSASSIHSY